MATNAGSISNVTIQKLVDGIIASVVRKDGTKPAAAPNAWKSRQGKQIDSTDTDEFTLQLKVKGENVHAIITPNGSKAESIQGPLDLTTLATKLV